GNDCQDAGDTSCDHRWIEVVVPAGGANVEVEIAPHNPTTDFDLYVYGPDGAELDRSATETGFESVVIPSAPSGLYRIDVDAYTAPLGDGYDGVIRLALPTPPPPPPPPPPNPETKRYDAPTGDAANASCAIASPGIGGACFNVLAGSTSAGLVMTDDLTATASGSARFLDASGAVIAGSTTPICGSATLTVPPNGARLQVFTRTATPPAGCTGRATTGSITVTWS
ncbi:MAG TPA: PPC domain-containing protein, partial [Acidimicrobiia bacterium]|nr:PPC domain-containing protein [Acidimicrobiia bacterium]